MTKVKGAVVIDKERCKGCEICVVACPSKVLALNARVNSKGYNYAYDENADECIGCAACALVCPDSCITVYRTKVE